jgi:flagellar biosynthesis protein FliQ
MTERIISELFDKSYETVLGICAACCIVSLLLAGSV